MCRWANQRKTWAAGLALPACAAHSPHCLCAVADLYLVNKTSSSMAASLLVGTPLLTEDRRVRQLQLHGQQGWAGMHGNISPKRCFATQPHTLLNLICTKAMPCLAGFWVPTSMSLMARHSSFASCLARPGPTQQPWPPPKAYGSRASYTSWSLPAGRRRGGGG